MISDWNSGTIFGTHQSSKVCIKIFVSITHKILLLLALNRANRIRNRWRYCADRQASEGRVQASVAGFNLFEGVETNG